jgi:rhodanese-related sulfurtransferase
MKALELNTLLNDTPSTRLLDVRTPSEFENAHISGAYNVPLGQLHEHAAEVRAAIGPVVLICQSGQRAQKAETMLRGQGMANVRVLEGGMAAWISSGLPTARIRARMSLERQVRILAGAIAASGAIVALTLWPLAAVVPALIGSGLVFAGVTDTCAMGMLLARLPYNRGAATCDTEVIVRQFLSHERASQ